LKTTPFFSARQNQRNLNHETKTKLLKEEPNHETRLLGNPYTT